MANDHCKSNSVVETIIFCDLGDGLLLSYPRYTTDLFYMFVGDRNRLGGLITIVAITRPYHMV